MNRKLIIVVVLVAFFALTAFAIPPLTKAPHHEAKITVGEVPLLVKSIPTTSTTTTTVPPKRVSPLSTSTTVRSDVQPKPAATGGTQPRPHRDSSVEGYAASCMANAPHSVALAHTCWDSLLAQYAWPTARAFSVMMCESQGNPLDIGTQTRWGRAVGLMQDMGGPIDPAQNMAVAFQKYQASGWGPWSSSESCWVSAQNG